MKAPGVWSKKTWCNSGNHWKSVPPQKIKIKRLHGKFEIATFRIDPRISEGKFVHTRERVGERYFLQMSSPKKFNESSLTT